MCIFWLENILDILHVFMYFLCLIHSSFSFIALIRPSIPGPDFHMLMVNKRSALHFRQTGWWFYYFVLKGFQKGTCWKITFFLPIMTENAQNVFLISPKHSSHFLPCRSLLFPSRGGACSNAFGCFQPSQFFSSKNVSEKKTPTPQNGVRKVSVAFVVKVFSNVACFQGSGCLLG